MTVPHEEICLNWKNPAGDSQVKSVRSCGRKEHALQALSKALLNGENLNCEATFRAGDCPKPPRGVPRN